MSKMPKELVEFVTELDRITQHILQDGGPMYGADADTDEVDPADVDDEPTIDKVKPMMDQLGKIVDSDGNPNPVTTVNTEDGKQVEVTPQQAKVIMMLASNDKVKPNVKAQLQKDIHNSKGLGLFLVDNPKEAISNFMSKYIKGEKDIASKSMY